MKKAWRPFGVDMTLKAPGIKNIIEWGLEIMITSDQLDEIANKYNKNKDKYTYDLWFEKVKEWANGVNNTRTTDCIS